MNEEINIIKERIVLIRGQRVMLDYDLAELYQVPTKVLIQAVKRNINRFPEDFMFSLSEDEFSNWSQIVTSSQRHRKKRYLPYAFTEHGVAMLSSVLKSDIAIAMNIFITRAFIKMREYMNEYKDLALDVEKIKKVQKEDHDLLKNVNATLSQLIVKPEKSKSKIGFNQS